MSKSLFNKKVNLFVLLAVTLFLDLPNYTDAVSLKPDYNANAASSSSTSVSSAADRNLPTRLLTGASTTTTPGIKPVTLSSESDSDSDSESESNLVFVSPDSVHVIALTYIDLTVRYQPGVTTTEKSLIFDIIYTPLADNIPDWSPDDSVYKYVSNFYNFYPASHISKFDASNFIRSPSKLYIETTKNEIFYLRKKSLAMENNYILGVKTKFRDLVADTDFNNAEDVTNFRGTFKKIRIELQIEIPIIFTGSNLNIFEHKLLDKLINRTLGHLLIPLGCISIIHSFIGHAPDPSGQSHIKDLQNIWSTVSQATQKKRQLRKAAKSKNLEEEVKKMQEEENCVQDDVENVEQWKFKPIIEKGKGKGKGNTKKGKGNNNLGLKGKGKGKGINLTGKSNTKGKEKGESKDKAKGKGKDKAKGKSKGKAKDIRDSKGGKGKKGSKGRKGKGFVLPAAEEELAVFVKKSDENLLPAVTGEEPVPADKKDESEDFQNHTCSRLDRLLFPSHIHY